MIYASHRTGERVVIEVTAISDAGLHERNPVTLFRSMLDAHAQRLRGVSPGAFHFQIGHALRAGKVVLGVPERRDMASFFKSREFLELLARIRRNPGTDQRLEFKCRDAQSVIVYRSGAKTSGGGHLAYEVVVDIEKNHIYNRLAAKDEQIKKSNAALPGIVILCDADCRLLSSSISGLGNPTWIDVVDGFLNGRAFPFGGRRTNAKTTRLNAVVATIARENRNFSTGDYTRHIDVKYVPKRSGYAHPVSATTIEEVAESLLSCPPLRRMPINAAHEYARPAHYGGYQIEMRSRGGAVKLSLLTLQQLICGRISYSEFAEAHPDLARLFARYNEEGLMISKIGIQKCSDEDDDWVRLEFDDVIPSRILEKMRNLP